MSGNAKAKVGTVNFCAIERFQRRQLSRGNFGLAFAKKILRERIFRCA